MFKPLLAFFTGPKLWAALVAIGLILGGVGSGCAVKAVEDGRYAKLEAKIAKDAEKAQQVARKVEQASGELGQKTGTAAAVTDTKIVTRTITRIKEVPRYVTVKADAVACIPWGAVRVLDAAAQGLDPADLPAPAGQPDDACSDVTASALAAGVTANYGIAQQNAAQLNALQEDIRERAKLYNEGQP